MTSRVCSHTQRSAMRLACQPLPVSWLSWSGKRAKPENVKHCKTSTSRNHGKRSKNIRLLQRLRRALQLEEGSQPTQAKQEHA